MEINELMWHCKNEDMTKKINNPTFLSKRIDEQQKLHPSSLINSIVIVYPNKHINVKTKKE